MSTPEAQQEMDAKLAKQRAATGRYGQLAAEQLKHYQQKEYPPLLAAELTFAVVKAVAMQELDSVALAFYHACGAMVSQQVGEVMAESIGDNPNESK